MSRFPLLAACFALFALAGLAASLNLGAPLSLKASTPIADLIRTPAKFLGKQVQVKGRVTEVCQKAGCWMMLVDDASGKSVRIKVSDGEIVFPKDAAGSQAIAEGVFTSIARTRQQTIAALKHEAEEQSRAFDPSAITSDSVIYQIQGTGARILEK